MRFHWAGGVLYKFVAPDIAEFNSAIIEGLEGDFPQAQHWVANHFLNNVLRARYSEEKRQVVCAYIRRVFYAFRAYHEARELTHSYLVGVVPTNPDIRAYFDALYEWESFILQSAMAIDLLRGFSDSNTNVFEKGDGSAEQRLYDMANLLKHFKGGVKNGLIETDVPVPIWLNNEGLSSANTLKLTYEEAKNTLVNLCFVADRVQDPLSIANKDRLEG